MTEYSPQLQTCLFQCLILYSDYSPFCCVSIQNYVKKQMGILLPFDEIEQFYQKYYNKPIQIETKEFSLPFNEFHHLIDAKRRAEIESDTESLEKPKKKRKSLRRRK